VRVNIEALLGPLISKCRKVIPGNLMSACVCKKKCICKNLQINIKENKAKSFTKPDLVVNSLEAHGGTFRCAKVLTN
jgi:hypothetical protein